MEITLSDLLPCHCHLLDNNFHDLGIAETIQQQIWIASMESALKAASRATAGQIKPGRMMIFNKHCLSAIPHRSKNHHSQTTTRPCPDPQHQSRQQSLPASFWIPPLAPPGTTSPPEFPQHWPHRNPLLPPLEKKIAMFPIWVWSDLYASSHSKYGLLGHNIAPVRLLCLYGGKERQKLVCPYHCITN